MTTGFRGSPARHGGRTVAALIALIALGQAGLVAPATVAKPLVVSANPPMTPAADARLAPSNHPIVSVAAPGILLAAGPTASASEADVEGDSAGLQPSIQYEEAERHAHDRIDFAPGGRVTMGFRPRPGDSWTVGGGRPTALPAGRLDGRAIRGQGAHPSAPTADDAAPTDPSIDRPSRVTAPTVATDASFRVPESTATSTTDVAVSPTGLRREIFGFLPYWEVNSSSLRLDYSKISTIAYFGVGADASGNLQKRNADGSTTVGWSGWTSSKMTSVISTAHSNHTRVVLTVQSFGWNTSGLDRQKVLLGSSTHRLNLAKQIAAAVRDRGADGVNLDFEPLASTYDAEFTALVRSIRTQLNAIHSGYQITFDTTGSIGNYPIADATAPGGADAIFIMGYDYRSSSSSPVGSIAPLNRSGYDIRDTVAAYAARVAPSKLILGVPYYGRAWSTATGALHATNTSSTKTGASTTVVYDTAADYLAQHGHHYDAGEGVAWTAYQRQNCTSSYGCVTSWRELYIDDATALGSKYDLVNTYGLRGAGIWALGYDGTRPELWAAIQRKFVTDTTAPTAGIRTLAARQLNPSFTVAWTGHDDVAVASYDVQVSTDGGPWVGWQAATTAASAVWYGSDNHAYAFRVRARDLKGNLGAWNVTATSATAGSALVVGGFGVVRLDGLSIRAAADTSATKLGTYSTGDLVQVVSGPASADSYTWYRVVGPLTTWGPSAPLATSAWVAAFNSGTTLVSPAKAPNATRVAAAIGDLAFGGGGAASIGADAAAAAHRVFSPNGDGSGDTIAIDWSSDRALDTLALRVFRADGSLAGSVPVGMVGSGAHRLSWTGRVGGSVLPDGRYLVSLVGSAAGVTFSDPSPTFQAGLLASFGITIDTVRPVITASSVSGTLLSPNGDGRLDTVRVGITATGADGWTFRASPLSGSSVGPAVTTRSGSGRTPSVTWDGRTNGGSVVADGLYRLSLIAIDHAGNHAAHSWTVRVDATRPVLGSAAAPTTFSPNADGAADTTRLTWSASEALTGAARILSGTTTIRAWTVTARSSGAITWTGTDSAGHAVPDGTYVFRIAGRDAAGNPATRILPVVVNRTLSTLRWSHTAFYPQDGDRIASSSAFSFSLKRAAVVTVAIYRGSTLIRTIWTNHSFASGAHAWTWNGRDGAGNLVARGSYTVRVSARSSVGTSVLSRSVLVDAFRTSLSATTLRAGQTLTITLITTEALRANPTVTLTQHGRTAVSRTATALGSGRYRVSFAIAAGGAGTAVIAIKGRDTAGGLNTSTRTITVE